MTDLLTASHLRKAYGGLVVTDDVSLTLASGARHALIGPNGAGKTTLVGLLCGAVRPDAGSVAIEGVDVTRADARRRVKRGLVRTFQVTSLFPGLTARENVLLGVDEQHAASGRMLRPWRSERLLLDRADALLAQVGLSDVRFRRVSELAYGRQRLLEIAVALALEPKVLLLDEPAAGVPGADAGALLEALDRLPACIAILMIEHDMHMVRRFARSVSVLVAGRIVAEGAPDDVMRTDLVREVYLGKGGQARYGT